MLSHVIGIPFNKVMAQARVWWHGTLSVSPISWISAYLIDNAKTGTAAFVWHAQAFDSTSVSRDTFHVRYDTRAKRRACDIARVS